MSRIVLQGSSDRLDACASSRETREGEKKKKCKRKGKTKNKRIIIKLWRNKQNIKLNKQILSLNNEEKISKKYIIKTIF